MPKSTATTSAAAVLAALATAKGEDSQEIDNEALNELSTHLQNLLNSNTELENQLTELKTELEKKQTEHAAEIKNLTDDFETRLKSMEDKQVSNEEFAAKVMAHTGIAPVEGESAGDGGEDTTPENRTIEQHQAHYQSLENPREASLYYEKHIRPALFGQN